ncbi:MAG: hypothetical protein HOP28_00425 [Gemmatimonadales bacterium]|nr:hypothetical protein [Gemmatimonadales bacterium]
MAGRVLTAAQAIVPAERVTEYLAAARAHAVTIRRNGEHFWLFRHPAAPGRFLEFHERASGAARARVALPATYDAEADVVWEEVPLEER